jgi:hypothetical protein
VLIIRELRVSQNGTRITFLEDRCNKERLKCNFLRIFSSVIELYIGVPLRKS